MINLAIKYLAAYNSEIKALAIIRLKSDFHMKITFLVSIIRVL